MQWNSKMRFSPEPLHVNSRHASVTCHTAARCVCRHTRLTTPTSPVGNVTGHTIHADSAYWDYAEVTKSQAHHPETPKIPKNPRTGKIITILHLYMCEPVIAFWAIVSPPIQRLRIYRYSRTAVPATCTGTAAPNRPQPAALTSNSRSWM